MYPPFRWATETYRFVIHEQAPLHAMVMQDDARLAFSNSLLSDTLAIPSLVAACSAGILFIHSFVTSRIYMQARNHVSETLIHEETDDKSRGLGIRGRSGGNVIFAYQVARLVGCLVLTGISIYSSVMFRREVYDLAMSASYVRGSFIFCLQSPFSHSDLL